MNSEDDQLGEVYRVEKLQDPSGKHDRCKYFILDPEHDVHARDALRQYAVACKTSKPLLATQIVDWLAKYPMTPLVTEQVANVNRIKAETQAGPWV